MAQQAQELAAVDARLKQRLADARTAIGERFSRQIADYRSSLRKSRGESVEKDECVAESVERPGTARASSSASGAGDASNDHTIASADSRIRRQPFGATKDRG